MKCSICKFQNKSKLELPCLECTSNRAVDYFKSMTNADRIRNMTYAELADFLHNIGSYVEDGEPLIDIFVGEEKTTISDNFGSIKEWLQAEVKEG